MDCSCNFKVALSRGKTVHVFGLLVVCHRSEFSNRYFYVVRGESYSDEVVLLSPEKDSDVHTFNTPEEAFFFADKIVEKYPPYGDGRDYNINLAPLYEGVEM